MPYRHTVAKHHFLRCNDSTRGASERIISQLAHRLLCGAFTLMRSVAVCADHSVRSAFIGAILAARFAGTMAAINEQIPSAKVAVPRAGGSHHLTP